MVAFSYDVSWVKLLLFAIAIGHDAFQKLLGVFCCSEVRSGFWLFEEVDQWDVAPPFVLEQYFSEGEEKASFPFDSPVVLDQVDDEDILYLLAVQTYLPHYLLCYQLFAQVVQYHHSGPIYLPVLALHLLR